MRSCGEAGHADSADDLALRDALALAQAGGKARQVGIQRAHAVLVFDDDDIAVTTLDADEADDAFGRSLDTGAGGGGEINPFVGAHFLQYRMETSHAEAGADP